MNRQFPKLNHAFNMAFKPGQMTIGLVAPLESYPVQGTPTMERHIENIQLADQLGFAAVWLRDVPFNVPSFGDVGQMYDPFVYLGLLSGATQRIALGVGSLILPLRHPAHVAKSAATVDQLSNGRLLLGVASGDRHDEYPAMGISYHDRGTRFQDSMHYIRAMADSYPYYQGMQGHLQGFIDMLPKPTTGHIPMLITGGSAQPPEWVAEHSDGWITYPRDTINQAQVVNDYRARVAKYHPTDKPVVQSLYIDLVSDPDTPPRPIHLGFQSGITFLKSYLSDLQS
ncbi:MAG: TIGR03571 family LLM class oxidoreductase, partial [Pseudomonadota bacterium]